MAPTVYTPPVNTYIPIGSVTLSATASEVVFSSLPTSGYRDLVVVFIGAASTAADLRLRLNGDTGNSYTNVAAGGRSDGAVLSIANSSAISRLPVNQVTTLTTGQFQSVIQIMDYATDKHKTLLIRNAQAGVGVDMNAGRWANTAAVTSVTLYPETATFSIGSTFSLFAIAG